MTKDKENLSQNKRYLESKIEWIPCDEQLPTFGDAFLVIVKHKDFRDGSWLYDVDMGYSFGDYIDNFWDTFNDWCEGQEVHITHWADIPLSDELCLDE